MVRPHEAPFTCEVVPRYGKEGEEKRARFTLLLQTHGSCAFRPVCPVLSSAARHFGTGKTSRSFLDMCTSQNALRAMRAHILNNTKSVCNSCHADQLGEATTLITSVKLLQ